MQNVLHCDCGFEVHADDEAELVAEVQRHALDAHRMHFSREDVLQLAFRAELGEKSWQQRLDTKPVRTSRDPETRRNREMKLVVAAGLDAGGST